MHVDVHLLVRNVETHDGDGETTLHQESPVRLVQGERQASVLHPATVHVDRYVVPVRPRERWPADQTADLYVGVFSSLRFDVQHRFRDIGPVHRRHGFA